MILSIMPEFNVINAADKYAHFTSYSLLQKQSENVSSDY
jgi:hypothetical protein